MKSLPAAVLFALSAACIVPCNHPSEPSHHLAVGPMEATLRLQPGPQAQDCTICEGLQAPAPAPVHPEGHDDGPGGADCAICAGINAPSPSGPPNPNVPGGTGPPGGWGTPPGGSTPGGIGTGPR